MDRCLFLTQLGDIESFFPRKELVPVIQQGYGCPCSPRRKNGKGPLYLCCHSKHIDLATDYDYCPASPRGDCNCIGTAIEPVAINIKKIPPHKLGNEVAKYLSKGTKCPTRHFTSAEQLADVIQHYWKAKRWTAFGSVFKKLAELEKPKKEALCCPKCGSSNIRTIPEDSYRPKEGTPP